MIKPYYMMAFSNKSNILNDAVLVYCLSLLHALIFQNKILKVDAVSP